MIMIYEIIIQNLARDTQRTLVLPPVLPHVGDVTKKYDWGPRVNEVIEETSYIQMVKQDALQVAMGDPEQFSSFQALVDFNFFTATLRNSSWSWKLFGSTIPHGRYSPEVLKKSLYEEH